MDKLTRGRRPLRAQLTRTTNEISDIISADKPDHKALKIARDSLEKTVVDLESFDVKVQAQLVEDGATDEAIDEEQKNIEKYRRLYLSTWADIEQFNSSTADVAPSAVGSAVGDGKKRKFHLPEVKLKSYGGNLKEWLGWWSQFEKIHLDEELHDTDKFQYLSQSMEVGSEAKAIVDSYPQTEGNYDKAVQALRDRFGRQDLLLQVYVRELLTLVIGNVTSSDKLPLAQLFVRLESHLRCLAELNLDQADPATWLFPLVESSLSAETLRAWQRSPQSKMDGYVMVPKKSRLDLLMEFMKSEVQCEQQISLAQEGFQSKSPAPPLTFRDRKPRPRSSMRSSFDIPTAAGLLNQQTTGCGFCSKPHESDKCFKAQKMTMDEKRKIIRERDLCFQCLSVGHIRRMCMKKVRCESCSGPHYSIMCSGGRSNGNSGGISQRGQAPLLPPTKRPRVENQQQQSKDQIAVLGRFSQNSNQCSRTILMNTLKANVKDKDGNVKTVRLVGDSGSQRSYVSSTTCRAGGALYMEEEWLQNVLFGGEVTAPDRFSLQELVVYGLEGGSVKLQLLEKAQITGEICGVPRGPWIEELNLLGIKLSDIGGSSSTADILIGNDYWGTLRTGRMVKLACGLVAEETVLGWTLGGPIPTYTPSMMVNTMTVGSQDIEKLWSLEAIGIRDTVEVKAAYEENQEALAHFSKNISRTEDGRYVVALPWKVGNFELPSNRKIAEQRLRNTTFKLVKNGKFADYHDVFVGWEKEKLIRKMENELDGGHYIPHRPVYKESPTTPVRTVFDASCKQGRSPSLNDCLHKGPNLIELIPAMMLRFGESEIGVSSDIRKAFQMITVKEEDQEFQRFLWWKDETCTEMVVYQHQRVVFGLTCSPFLLGATIHHFLNSLEDKELADKLKFSFYVDNLVTSVSSKQKYEKLRMDATKMMSKAKLELRQWACSMGGENGVDSIPIGGQSKGGELFTEKVMPVLGMLWDREKDTLSCVIKKFAVEVVTKRNMLSVVAQVFDPMGYLCPALLFPKMLVQETWATKLGWDAKVPEAAEKQFVKWAGELEDLVNVRVPRYQQVCDASTREVHVFVDSSQDAMAAVAFLRTELNGEIAVQFLLAKSRLTLVKKPTIPRSELVSCVIGVRVAKCVQEALLLTSESFTYWSDSSTALAWIRRNGDWGIFVRNRVLEILNFSSPEQWHHVPGVLNPADLPSRGCKPSSLVKSNWWKGPTWLCNLKAGFPNSEPVVNDIEVNVETKKVSILLNAVNVVPLHFSSYRKNVAVWGWVLRFVNGCRKETREKSKFLTLGELRRAERVLVGLVQAETFPEKCVEVGGIRVFRDAEKLLRVKTRLCNRNDTSDFIYPLLMPKTHPLVDMLIMDVHKFHGHGGVQFLTSKLREKYWVVNARQTVRKVVRRCVQCQRHSGKHLEVDPASLPAGRVESSRPFATTGVDLAGPMFLKDGEKAWVVLYTCAVYRGIYLDIVASLSTEAFLRSLERFIALYGRPNTIYSDNGTNFVGAANLFKQVDWEDVKIQCKVRQIQWIFNPPTAAWWGGWWERLIRSVKDLLKRMLGRSKLSADELRTCLAGVTATINDRPLTALSEDVEDLIPLTPAMFMKPPESGHFPELGSVEHLQKSYIRMKELQLQLQNRFRKEYLAHLVTRSGKRQQSAITVGDVVLVGADNRKRFEWPLGVVMELLPGKDAKVRVVKVRTANGILTRPLQRLFPLEVSQPDKVMNGNTENAREQVNKLEAVQRTRSGRISNRPTRYGQWTHLI